METVVHLSFSVCRLDGWRDGPYNSNVLTLSVITTGSTAGGERIILPKCNTQAEIDEQLMLAKDRWADDVVGFELRDTRTRTTKRLDSEGKEIRLGGGS